MGINSKAAANDRLAALKAELAREVRGWLLRGLQCWYTFLLHNGATNAIEIADVCCMGLTQLAATVCGVEPTRKLQCQLDVGKLLSNCIAV
jgi:hypothetical protein